MRLHDDPETAAFRAELGAYLDANAPSPEVMAEGKHSSAHLPDWARAWQRRLFDDGWLVPGWPPELGGRNATPWQSLIYLEELSRRRIPRALNPQGLGIIAPSLHDFGTAEQRERYLLPTLRGEVTWCLGMSEPGAGSDFAGLRTRAAPSEDGTTWRIDGQKVWTSGAHDADLCFCFVRTEPELPKHRGISVLVVDMRTPGITCRSLPELTDPDAADFNEVFFDGVEVPADNLVGERGQGWAISMNSLGHERGMLWLGQYTALQGDVEELVRLGHRHPELGSDARFRDAVAALYVDAQAMGAMGYRGFAKVAAGKAAPEHLTLKLYGSEARQRAAAVGVAALGADAFDRDRLADVVQVGEGCWEEAWLRTFSNTIAGGTSEIQRTIIAERVLGLPRA